MLFSQPQDDTLVKDALTEILTQAILHHNDYSNVDTIVLSVQEGSINTDWCHHSGLLRLNSEYWTYIWKQETAYFGKRDFCAVFVKCHHHTVVYTKEMTFNVNQTDNLHGFVITDVNPQAMHAGLHENDILVWDGMDTQLEHSRQQYDSQLDFKVFLKTLGIRPKFEATSINIVRMPPSNRIIITSETIQTDDKTYFKIFKPVNSQCLQDNVSAGELTMSSYLKKRYVWIKIGSHMFLIDALQSVSPLPSDCKERSATIGNLLRGYSPSFINHCHMYLQCIRSKAILHLHKHTESDKTFVLEDRMGNSYKVDKEPIKMLTEISNELTGSLVHALVDCQYTQFRNIFPTFEDECVRASSDSPKECVSASSDSPTECVGFLTKRARSAMIYTNWWHKRWFVLDKKSKTLSYHSGNERKGIIFLNSRMFICEPSDSKLDAWAAGKKHCFQLRSSTPEINLYAYADNDTDKNMWIEALTQQIQQLKEIKNTRGVDSLKIQNIWDLDVTELRDNINDIRKIEIEIDSDINIKSAHMYKTKDRKPILDQYRELFSKLISFIKTFINVTELHMWIRNKGTEFHFDFDIDTQLERLVNTCQKLSKLDLQGMKVTNKGVRNIVKHLKQPLVDLNLAHTLVTDIDALQFCTNLTDVDLSHTGVKDINALKKCAELRNVKLGYTQVTDIDALQFCTNLTDVDLSHTDVKDINALQKCTKLRNVKLGYTKVTNIDAFNHCQKLKSLDISHTKVDDIKTLCSRTGVLEEVKLDGNRNITRTKWYEVNYTNSAEIEFPSHIVD